MESDRRKVYVEVNGNANTSSKKMVKKIFLSAYVNTS